MKSSYLGKCTFVNKPAYYTGLISSKDLFWNNLMILKLVHCGGYACDGRLHLCV